VASQKFYLDKANAKLWGVCAGIADYTGVDSLWIRIGAVLLTVMITGLTIPAYILAAMLADKKPHHLYDERDEERLLDRMRRDRSRSRRTRESLADIDRRVSDMEAHYTSRSSSRLAAEIDSLR